MYKQAFNWQSLMPGHPLFGFCHRYFLLLLFLKLASKLHFYSRQQKLKKKKIYMYAVTSAAALLLLDTLK